MRRIGASLARTIYGKPVTILVSGEMGAGKTTFIQGLGRGLQINRPIVSPTFALEQRYGETLCHIDLYRLTPPESARSILEHSESFPGIRAIEWAERTMAPIEAGIDIKIIEDGPTSRTVECTFSDIAIPSDREIERWMDEVLLPENVRQHSRAVAAVCSRITESLMKQWRFVRLKTLRAAALTHDLMRFLNFHTPVPGEPVPTEEQTALWERLKKTLPSHHEEAGATFLFERGFPVIGAIVRPHQGIPKNMDLTTATTEQLALAYADKRIIFDKVIGLSERFSYLVKRYGDGQKKQHYEERRKAMQRVEQWLFPNDPPF